MRRGFTLVDILVSIFVIAVLIGLLLPSLGIVNEQARRTVCQSNIRQVGLGVLMYADQYRGFLPPSVFLGSENPSPNAVTVRKPEEMVVARVDPAKLAGETSGLSELPGQWDGLGLLYIRQFLETPQIFYCPSHRGEHRFRDYADRWGAPVGEIVTNYHYRGEGPTGAIQHGVPHMTRNLFMIDPAQSSLLADGMRFRSDFNHRDGSNFFRADLTVHWFSDPGETVYNSLPDDKDEANPAVVSNAWRRFDESVAD